MAKSHEKGELKIRIIVFDSLKWSLYSFYLVFFIINIIIFIPLIEELIDFDIIQL